MKVKKWGEKVMSQVKISIFILMMVLLSTKSAYCYEEDYGLDGIFIIERINSWNGYHAYQIWELRLKRALVEGKERFIDFSLIVINLSKENEKGERIIKDLANHDYEEGSEFNSVIFANGTFHFSFGMGWKLYIKVEFNNDGSLKNITGSSDNTGIRDGIITYRLVKDKINLKIIEKNRFLSSDPLFHNNYRFKRR